MALAGLPLAVQPARADAPADQQLSLAGAGAIKLVVRGQGWVRVARSSLVAAGLDAGADPATLQLYADGVEQALAVTGSGADEAIEFWGMGRDTLSTDARTYWLVAGQAAGARISAVTPPQGQAGPASFVHAASLVERNVYLSSVRNGEASNFYGAAVSTAPTTRTITVRHLDVAGAGQSVLAVSLQGVTATPHVVDVALGGVPLGTCELAAQEAKTCSFAAPGVVEGDNVVTLTAEDAADYSATANLEIDYAHAFVADGDALALTAPGATRLTIAGFPDATVRAVDVTDAAHPVELTVTATANGGAYDARLDVPAGGTRSLYLFCSSAVRAPASIVRDEPSAYGAAVDGELLILTHASLKAAVMPLASQRAAEGWSVQVVDLQDVYDERGFGDKSPDAVRAFIHAARGAWRTPPRFVLLVGDASFDPRNFLGKGDFDLAPTKLVDTATMETASDDWFVDDDLDGVPEIAIGRFAARTPDQVAAIVHKTMSYGGRAEAARGGLFVSDVDDVDLDFGAASAAAASASGLTPSVLFSRADSGATSDALVAKLNAGPFLVNYVGHGSVEVWDQLLTSAQASALTTDHPSIYVVMNCLNGFFHDLYTTSLAESLSTAPAGGAVAVWASSMLADYDPQPAYDRAFLGGLARTSLGEAAIGAKAAVADLDTRRSWILFGDPTLLGAPSGQAHADAGAPDASSADAGSSDSGAQDAADAGAPSDGSVAVDAGANDVDAAGQGTGDAAGPHDAAPADAMASDGKGAPLPASGGGCGCSTGRGPSPSGGAVGLLLALVALARRRSVRRRPRLGAMWQLVIVLGALVSATRAQAAYGYRMAITIDRTRIGTSTGPTTLSNYPLLLDVTSTTLKTTGNGGHVQNASGYDISFQGVDSTTCGGPSTCTFKYEIESYTASTGRVLAWVNIPTLKTTANTANTVIVVMYGDASISSATQNQTGTWNSSYQGVWHLNQATSPQTDSTATPANASSNGMPAPATATGLIGSGMSTSGATGTGYLDYKSTKFNWLSTDSFTYQGWFKTTDGSGPLFGQRDMAGGPVIDINLGYNGVTTNANNMSVLVRDDGNTTNAQVNGTTAVNDGNWHQFAVTRTGGTIEVYVDGASIGANTNTGASGSITTGAYYQNIGREGNWVQAGYGSADQQYLAGTFDEFRVSKTVLSAAWLKTDFNTQGAPASTFSLGGEVLASCGDGTVISGEACDDGNVVSGDGCSTSCTIETGFTCTGTAPSVCRTTCGDGVVGGSETCDDSNAVNGDGCSSTCTVESLYHCTGSPSTCTFAQFSYYKTITIDRTQVGTASGAMTLSNYPMLISVTDTSLMSVANGGRVRSASGYDIIFQGDMTTCGVRACTFSHQIESYDPATGTLIAWVNIPILNTQRSSSNSTFHMLFGNRAISTPTELTSTWDSSFTGVWHLGQNPTGTAPQMTDGTSNGNNGTTTSVTAATGLVGSGVTMNGTTSYIAVNSGSSLDTPSGGSFTYSGWVKTTDTFGGILSLRSSTSSTQVIDVMVGMDGSSTSSGKLMALVRDDAGAVQGDSVASGTFNNGAWHMFTVTHSGTSMTLYLDKTPGTAVPVSAGSFTMNLRNFGREGRWIQDSYTTPTTNAYLAGTIDEFRASSTDRSVDWITTDYNCQSASCLTGYTTGTAGEVATDIKTSVTLLSFTAAASCADTVLSWRTAFEAGVLGWNAFRETDGTRVPLNSALLPGAAFMGGAGQDYRLVDAGPLVAGRRYWLEQVDLDLTAHSFGPVSPSTGCASSPSITSPGVPAPVGAAATSTEPGAPEAGGCTVAGGAAGGAASGLAFALLVIAARRRRRS